MKVAEKVAYIKGLAEGMKIDDSTNEGKLTLAMLDALKDIASELGEIDETLDDMAEIVSDIEDSVCELEEEVYGNEDLPDYVFDDDELYEITCAKCDNTFSTDMDVIESGSVKCPNCGDLIEFDIECEGEHD